MYTFTATNNGPKPCSLDGYPVVAFFGPSGAGGAGAGTAISVTLTHINPGPSLVTLATKGTSSFTLVIDDEPINGIGCPTVASLEITPPGSSEALTLPSALQPCGDAVSVSAFAGS